MADLGPRLEDAKRLTGGSKGTDGLHCQPTAASRCNLATQTSTLPPARPPGWRWDCLRRGSDPGGSHLEQLGVQRPAQRVSSAIQGVDADRLDGDPGRGGPGEAEPALDGSRHVRVDMDSIQAQLPAEAVDHRALVPEGRGDGELPRAAKFARQLAQLDRDRPLQPVEHPNHASPPLCLGRPHQVLGGAEAGLSRLVAHRGRRCQGLEEASGVEQRVSGEAVVQVLERLQVPAPAAIGEVAGPHDEVDLVLGRQNDELRVEYPSSRRGDRLELVVPADPPRPELAERAANRIDISEHAGLARAAPHELVQNNGLEESEAEGVGGEGSPAPGVRARAVSDQSAS